MRPILVLYATREGHTRRVAEHVAATLRARGLAADVVDAKAPPATLSLPAYAAAVLTASVHFGHHEKEMVAFVKEHRAELDAMPTAFLSVSGTEAAAERATASDELRAKSAEQVAKVLDDFILQTGWRPRRVKPVAGAVAYSQYGFFIRLALRMVARHEGSEVDVTKDAEYTDWKALDAFVEELARELPSASPD